MQHIQALLLKQRSTGIFNFTINKIDPSICPSFVVCFDHSYLLKLMIYLLRKDTKINMNTSFIEM